MATPSKRMRIVQLGRAIPRFRHAPLGHCADLSQPEPNALDCALSTIARDTLPVLGQDRPNFFGGFWRFMPSLRKHARWFDAARTTVLLWSFVLLVFLPVIIERHRGEPWTGVALDCSTVLVSMALAMVMFVVSRATIELPPLVRLPLRAVTVILFAAANTAFDLLFQAWIADHFLEAWAALPSDFGRAYSSMLNYILVFGVNMILFHVNYTRSASVAQERRISEAYAAAHQAQLQALRYQLNPHFLFNALNSISALIVTKRNADAEEMTEKLASFLRNSLNADPAELIPLEEELALTEEYLDIESVRFGERLDVSVDCSPEACAARVPSFLVQPLVENAIKHGVARATEPVKIAVEGRVEGGQLCIRVANCLIPQRERTLRGLIGPGVGLLNVRRRLEAVFGDEATLVAGPQGEQFVATICLPEVKRAN